MFGPHGEHADSSRKQTNECTNETRAASEQPRDDSGDEQEEDERESLCIVERHKIITKNSHTGEKIGIRRIIKGGVEKLGCLAISIVASAAASAIA
jgi:hypothetical protein